MYRCIDLYKKKPDTGGGVYMYIFKILVYTCDSKKLV